jgi:hypothetical protein
VLNVPLAELTSTRLELEVERSGAPLVIASARLLVRPKRLLFLAPTAGALRLVYGSSTAAAPTYDVGRALSQGIPQEPTLASLGPVVDRGLRAAPPVAPRVVLADAARFRSRAAIELPKQGNLAYLDLAGMAPAEAHHVRIVDSAGRQVPFIVEAEPRRVKVPLKVTSESKAGRTTLRLTGFDPRESLSALELVARSPAFFQRNVDVFERTRDVRGPTGKRGLGSARWEKRPEQAEARLSLSLSTPAEPELFVEIDDGDNAPLGISAASAQATRARIDFVFTPGESLTLLSAHPAPVPARYDLQLLAETLVESSALPAVLTKGTPPAPATADEAPARPAWFWLVFVAAGALVVAALARVLKSSAS